MPADHVCEARTVTVSAARSRSSPRSDDAQTILETTPEIFRKAVTCKFGRDGRIRTGGLLLPNQIQGVAGQRRGWPDVPFSWDDDSLVAPGVAQRW